MDSSKGWFFVLEGSDGSGKATQINLLSERLRAAGYDVAIFDFPRYQEDSSYFVRQYLEGNFGPASEVSPYTTSLFYALDRFEAAPQIRQALSDGKIVLSNRYVASNMAHQGGKFSSDAEQRGFFLWADSLEFQLMGIPRPSLNIFLRLPTKVSQKLIAQRSQKDGRQLDEHERDNDHLKKALQTFDILCQLFPRDFKAVECAPDGNLRSVTDISNLIWREVKPLLPPPPHQGKPRVVNLSNPTGDAKSSFARNSLLTPGAPQEPKSEEASLKVTDASRLLINELQSVPGLKLNYELTWGKSRSGGYYVPETIPPALKSKFTKFLNELRKNHLAAEESLQKYSLAQVKISAQELDRALAPLIPMAGTSNVEITAGQEALDFLASSLASSSLPEAKHLLQKIKSYRQTNLVKDYVNPDSQLKNMILDRLSPTLSGNTESWSEAAATPNNEFDLLPEALYSVSSSTVQEINAELDHWPYEHKLKGLKLALQQPASTILLSARYQFNCIADQLFIDDLFKLGISERLDIQVISPRFGYDVPEIPETVGLEEGFLSSFDKSLQMYSHLQASSHSDLAGYACLSGHKSRLKFTVTAQKLIDSAKKAGLTAGQVKLIGDLTANISEIHPVIGSYIAEHLRNSSSNTPITPAIPSQSSKANKSPRRQRQKKKR